LAPLASKFQKGARELKKFQKSQVDYQKNVELYAESKSDEKVPKKFIQTKL
jgi:hypothetical protein